MKKVLVLLLSCVAMVFLSCSSTKVERIDSTEVVDLDGYWNDTDVRLVCEKLIDECSKSSLIIKFEAKNDRKPVVIVGSIKNESDEHIDTSIIVKKFQNAIINNETMEFVSSKTERADLREEIQDQADHASEDSAKKIDNELGADYMLIGSINSIVQSNGKNSVRTYYVTIQLHDLETHKIMWSSENSDIKKVITRSSARL